MADAHCRGCRATFDRPLPAPYGSICPQCLAGGDIITLIDTPDDLAAARRRDADAKRTGAARVRRDAVSRRVGQAALSAAVRELRSTRRSGEPTSVGRHG